MTTMATEKTTQKLASSKTSNKRMPGPIEQAAASIYFERGSMEAIEKRRWRTMAISEFAVICLLSTAIVLMMPLKTIETIQISRDALGRVAVVNADAQKFTADDGVKQSWIIDWVTDLTEINSATWQRSIGRASQRSLGVAVDQIRDYLSKEDNQPAQILAEKPAYVREFTRQSVNMIDTNVALVRYTLTSRSGQTGQKVVKAYALTATLASVKQETREDVLRNPTGLAVQNFSISEELTK